MILNYTLCKNREKARLIAIRLLFNWHSRLDDFPNLDDLKYAIVFIMFMDGFWNVS
jgi:hypothetical protein